MRDDDQAAGAAPGPELVTLLIGAVRGLSQVFSGRMAASGFDDIRPTHGFALTLVGEDGTTATELGRRLGMTKQSAGEVVTHLARRGYVERHPDPGDRRARRITLTARGQEAVAIIWSQLTDIESAWGEEVGEAGLRDIADGLRAGLRALHKDELLPDGMKQAWWWQA